MWIDNLNNINENKPLGECPYCKSENLGYREVLLSIENNIGFANIWYSECKRAFHVSRGYFAETRQIGEAMPQDLNY